MTAVIMGLVAVVLLVLVVVALGMRSMNRRESALSSERIKAMAENKGPKPRRPAEETFFESFPQGFDAFEEPADRGSKQRAAGPRPAPRPGGRQASRPAQRGGKQPAAARGKRGVDEWGEPDDYDDDYWSRVRADDGGFGGTIAARMATPRPVTQSAADSPAGPASATSASNGSPSGDSRPPMADPDAVTVQAALPQRPAAAGLADLVEPARPARPAASADQKTVTFAAPTPDILGTLGAPSTGPLDSSPASDPFTTGPRPAGSGASTSGRSTRSARSGRRSAASADATTGAGRANGSFETGRGTGSYDIPGGTGPFGAPGSTGPFDVPGGAGSFDATGNAPSFEATPSPIPSTGFFTAVGGTGSSTGTGLPATGPFPSTGSFETGRTRGSFEATRGTGPFEAQGSAAPFDATPSPRPAGDASASSTGSFDTWAAYDTTRTGGASHGSTGPFASPDTGSSYAVTPPPSSASPSSASPGSSATPSGGWAARDVLDDPEPPRSASSWPNAETYQTPSYDGYPQYSTDPSYPATSSSYEVSAGWATIDESDAVTGPSPATGVPTGPSPTVSPYESAGYDVPSGQSYYGSDQQRQDYGDPQHPSLPEQNSGWPEQNTGGSWPSYDELYGDASPSAGARRGNHRNPDTDYPDYYR
ncbi:hypothetical protein N5079_04830 [Planotetraspora sp. A-T 1434]|uniref:hypothetical protein n=1 Tax=Planotetraspora sp. A-T 1434 TaxID=2979219 RepID=UPI0021C1FA4D|nr:hypothetical protein [Planotetraspora sp. A-T 1434]MCT9929542.1 hypothetical protein [Planotetraspora sp. A-T 1434]